MGRMLKKIRRAAVENGHAKAPERIPGRSRGGKARQYDGGRRPVERKRTMRWVMRRYFGGDGS